MPRLRNLVPGLLLAAPLFCAVAVAAEPTISVYKSPTCGCCTQWIGHLEDNGFEVNAVDVTDLGRIKSQAGMPPGSPGMETPNPEHYPQHYPEHYQVLLIGKDGSTSVFAEH